MKSLRHILKRLRFIKIAEKNYMVIGGTYSALLRYTFTSNYKQKIYLKLQTRKCETMLKQITK